jgi:RhtB (resistance to homoserine/threonine) family protein
VHELVAFAAVAAVLILTPGPDMALVTRNTVARGRRAGIETSAGVCAGVLVHGCAAALGLSAILRTSATAFTVVKLVGAAYLVFLGGQALWRSRPGAADEGALLGGAERRATGSPFRQGLLSNVLNPKLAVFFLTLLPQFIDPHDSTAARSLLLAGVYSAMCAVWLMAFTLAVTRVREALRSPRVTRIVERVTGSVLVIVGLRVAVDRR